MPDYVDAQKNQAMTPWKFQAGTGTLQDMWPIGERSSPGAGLLAGLGMPHQSVWEGVHTRAVCSEGLSPVGGIPF